MLGGMGQKRDASRECPRPLVGFGWIGWVSLVVLALAVVLAWRGGLGVRYQLMVWVTDLFGPESMFQFVYGLIFTAIWVWGPTFSVMTWLLILPAFHVAPRRIPRVWLGVLLVFGVGWPLSHAFPMAHLSSYVRASWVPSWLGSAASGWRATMTAELALVSLIGVGALAVMTRSKLVGIACVAAFLVSVARPALDSLWYWQAQVLIRVGVSSFLWNAIVLGAMYAWAIRLRLELHPAHACGACGYDLTGLTTGRCPECGEAVAISRVRRFVREIARRSGSLRARRGGGIIAT